ncbi:hypothetical protein M3Y94_00384200 [Aphelenchoides besseyi]|nr:hypothetical protein M3Y94_00384200 [Aphelenchoides besseyi]KAI6235060.1 hypothetical protein M3Y95_00011300 [Aphelenchoides besseyi]
MWGVRRFGDIQLERLYRDHQLGQNVSLLVYVLCVFTAALLLLALNHLPRPDSVLLLATISAALALALNILLNIRTPTKQNGLLGIIGLWLCATVGCMMASGGQNALLPVVIAYFALYTVFPYDLLWTMLTAFGLSLAQIGNFIFFPTYPSTIDQLLATILIHVWCNFIGIYLYITKTRLCRAAFLNSRNVLMSQHEALKHQGELETLLSASCPPHSLQTALNYLCKNKPTNTSVYTENYDNVTVLYATFKGLEDILSQIPIQDAVRLLNEFDARIDQLARKNALARVPSDSVILVGGIVPNTQDSHALLICQSAWDLLSVVRSFCEASTADLQVNIGIATGSLRSGIVGYNKWHYEIVGQAFEAARELSQVASMGTILVAEETRQLVVEDFATERVELNQTAYWRLLPSSTIRSTVPNSMLFPSQRRMSLITVPQAINRLLQSTASIPPLDSNAAFLANGQGRRKRKLTDSMHEKLELDEAESAQLINFLSLTFNESAIEKGYQFEVDRWFIPALATTIFFLVIYGIYQMLVLPRLILTLGLIILTLAIMFLILLMLYVSYFETFCHFVTRTSAGHSITILLILVLLFLCGIVNTFSCPPYAPGAVCQVVHYPMMSCVLWMITAAIFVRFCSLFLVLILFSGIGIFSMHMFVTHPDLYIHFALLSGWRIEFDVLIGMATLAVLIFIQARRNERLIRMDFVSQLRFNENMRRFDRIQEFISLTLTSQLPEHVAHNYLHRSDPYCHHCHSVGVITVRFGSSTDWQDPIALSRLQELLKEVDQLLMTYTGIEKVRSSHFTYTAAVGVLPEISKNVHDTPFTIGELLASLTNFGLALKDITEDEQLEIAIGIDCGPALSMVVGGSKPHYEVVGISQVRSRELMKAASQHQTKIVVSEDVYLALRPRHFDIDESKPIQVLPGLLGYSFRNMPRTLNSTSQHFNRPLISSVLPASFKQQTEIQMTSGIAQPFAPHRDVGSSAESSSESESESGNRSARARLLQQPKQNVEAPLTGTQKTDGHDSRPLDLHSLSFFASQNRGTNSNTQDRIAEDGNLSPKRSVFNSMNSSMSSELYSIDLSVETDSEMEWVTPEMLVYDRMRQQRPPSSQQNSKRASNVAMNTSGTSNRRMTYKGDCAKQYSDFSEAENIRGPSSSGRFRRKRYRLPLSRNGPKVPGWLSSRTSFNSELSLPQEASITALDKLNSTSKRIDRMLQELSNLNPASGDRAPDCAPFPLGFPGLSISSRSVNSNRREMSSACHTEYDNAESECGALSDSEMVSSSRLDELKSALTASVGPNRHQHSIALENRRHKRSRLADLASQLGAFGRQKRLPGGLVDNGNDGDVDSNCSSLASSAMFDRLRWKSANSIGYDNEYEIADFASETDETSGSRFSALSGVLPPPNPMTSSVPFGDGVEFRAVDEDSEDDNGNDRNEEQELLRQQMQQLSKDICNKFGNYKLASFSDADI